MALKIWGIVENKFPYTTFTSSDIQEIYEDEYNEPILLSIISTYLSRYCERGKVDRNKKGKEWIYKITRPSPVIETQARQQEPAYHQQQQHLSLMFLQLYTTCITNGVFEGFAIVISTHKVGLVKLFHKTRCVFSRSPDGVLYFP